MSGSLDALLSDPWALLGRAVDGPLHPGGTDATTALLDRAGVDEETTLLDVGCGAGEAVELARDRGARAVGLDRNPATELAIRGDITALPVADDSVDVVLGECVLCLSPDLGRTLEEIRRVLRPGGRLALSDVTVGEDPPELPAPIDAAFCLDAAHERGRLEKRVDAAGFDVADVRTHREDLLSMRDRLLDAVDVERILALLDDDQQLREGLYDLEAAVESGRVGYVSMVARIDR